MKKNLMLFILLIAMTISTFGQIYCSAGSASQSYEYISNVNFGSISNSSFVDNGGYTDFTTFSNDVNFVLGSPLSVTVSNLYSTDDVKVYIDWNQDGDFMDAGEVHNTINAGSTFNASILAPANAIAGVTTMRIVLFDSSFDTSDPCTIFTYGEVEDYSVNIVTSGCIVDAMFSWYPSGFMSYDFALNTQFASAGYFVSWDFGDGGSASNADNLSYTYSNDGTYDVTCTVTDLNDTSCTDSYTSTIAVSSLGCDYIIALNDDYGDGWNGGMLNISVNGTLVIPNATLLTGYGPGIYTLNVLTGDIISTSYSPGSWAYENSYDIYDGVGNLVFSDGLGGVNPTGGSVTVSCDTVVIPTGCSAALDYGYVNDPFVSGSIISYGEMWYYFEVDSLYPLVTVSLCNSDSAFDTKLEVWDACGGTQIGYNDDFCGLQSQLEFANLNIGTYYVKVYGYTNSFGNYELDIFSTDSIPCIVDASFTWWEENGLEMGMYTNYIYNSSGYYVEWTFGDGTMTSGADWVYHTYPAAGSYYVEVYVEDLNNPNCNDTQGQWIYTSAGSTCTVNADYDWTDLGNGEYSFYTLTPYSASAYNITWDFGDGVVVNNSNNNISHTYSASGTYLVSCLIEDVNDPTCWDQIDYWIQINVSIPCTADADFTFTDQGNMTFDFTTIANINLSEFGVDWDFDDGNSAYGLSTIHTFALPGSYDVSCFVYSYSDTSCLNIVTYTIVVSMPAPWTDPTITSSNHTILIPISANITIDGIAVSDGSYIGVFYNDSIGDLVCGGYTYYETTSGNNSFITAWGADIGFDGFANGEEFKWKIWDITTAIEFDATAAYNMSGVLPNDAFFVANGMSGIVSLSANSIETQDMIINSGWNIISTYIDPFEPALDSVFTVIASEVVIVKNGIGMVYWPLYGINSIGYMAIGEGYQVKMNSTQTLTVEGAAVVPEITPINIPFGWSIFGYLRQSPASIETLLNPIVNNITIVKNAIGLVYWPLYGINSIGNLIPGQGYQIKTDLAIVLTYPANSISLKSEILIPSPSKYTNVSNTGNNMTLGIPQQAWDLVPAINSEIGIFNNQGELLGSTVYSGENISIAIWGDDFTTDEIEGIENGESYSIILWDQVSKKEYKLEVLSWLEGDENFVNNGISVVKEFKTTSAIQMLSSLYQNVPNPFSHSTTIGFFLAKSANVKVKLYNSVGELLDVLVSENYEEGEHSIGFSSDKYSSGTYFYRIETENFVSTKSLLIQK